MGCVSSNLLNQDDDFPQLSSGSAFGHHIVKLTSTTYGLLTLDPPPSPPMTPPKKFTISTESKAVRSEPEVINSWELMSGLDAESFRFSPLPRTPVKYKVFGGANKENSDPNRRNAKQSTNEEVLKPIDLKSGEKFNKIGETRNILKEEVSKPLDLKLERTGEENRVVIYTTSLRGVRQTFEACNAVRAAVESSGVAYCERDVSMDRRFREELASLMGKREPAVALPPRVFVKGKYIGGAEEVLRLVDEGVFGELISGIPRKKAGDVACDGCGGLYFLPCFRCNGSCKVVKGWGSSAVVVRCTECNENGLVPCPICC